MGALERGGHKAASERVVLGGTDAILAAPVSSAASSGIALAPDIGGLRPLFDDLCARIASHGFAVCAPEPFAGVPRAERDAMDLEARMERVRMFDDREQLGDLERAAKHLRERYGVGRVAVVGFCMGGYYTLKAAATGSFERAVSFYGMIRTPERWRGAGHRDPIDSAGSVCPTLAILGDADVWTPPGDVDALRTVWRGAPSNEIVVYAGAEHGFVHDPERPAHRPGDAADAWRRALAFLGCPGAS